MLWLLYQVERLIYCFQESLPASRPPPVAFSPPNAPPISAPLVGILTLTIPQSLPVGLHYIKFQVSAKVKENGELICDEGNYKYSPNPFEDNIWLTGEDGTTETLRYRVVHIYCFLQSLQIYIYIYEFKQRNYLDREIFFTVTSEKYTVLKGEPEIS